MSEAITSTAVSESLVNRDIYSVCDTTCESIDHFHGELYQLRRRFYTEGKRNCHVRIAGEYLGCKSLAIGSMSRHSLKWKKVVNAVRTEEAFWVLKSFVVVLRDLNASICGKIYFDRENRWIKTEYFSSADYVTATVMLKPGESSDTIERFTYNEKRKNYDSETLYPLPYTYGSAKQSLLNAEHGEKLLLVSTGEGEFCYCSESQRDQRLKTLETLEDSEDLPISGWEPLEEEAVPEAEEEESDAIFDSMERAASKEEPGTIAPLSSEELSITQEDLTLELDEPSQEPRIVLEEEAENLTVISGGDAYNFTGKLMGGLREGRGRTDQTNGLTVFDGEYRHGLRHGFGSSYAPDGSLSYVGFFKNDKRSGAGIAFRQEDHAMHVTAWEDGKPGEFATLFDPQGNLRYCGKMAEGKKFGAGVTFQNTDKNFFVGRYEGSDTPRYGSLFDSEGVLLYTGEWKDGKRHGKGTEFDRDGQIVFSGEWKDDCYLNGVLYRKIDEK